MNRHSPTFRVERLEDRTTPTATALPFSVNAGNARWQLRNNGDGGGVIGPSQSGFAIFDANLVSPLRADAYDDAFLVGVNGTQYKDSDGIVDLTGTTVTTTASNIFGLNTSVELFFDPVNATVRAVYNFSNPTGSSISAPIQWGNNTGSDGSTKIENTTDGNTTLDVSDRWLITSDDSNADPVLTWVRFGTGAVQTPSSTLKTPGAGSDFYEEEFNLTVGAGRTRRLMFFGQLHTDVVGATADAAVFDDYVSLSNSGLLAGLNNQVLAEIVNWNFAPSGSLNAVDVTDIGAGNNINSTTVSSYTFSVTYTDPAVIDVKTLDNADIRVTGPNGFDAFATFDSVTPPNNAATVVATYRFTPPGGKWNVADNGDYTFTLQANSVQNVPGAGIDQTNLGTIGVDMHVPEVTINQSAGQADPTNGSPINFTVVFSEPVTGFDASDVLIGGTAGATTAQVSGGGATYTVSITGMTQSGTVTAGVKAGGAADVSNDANTVSTSTDNSVQFSTGPQGSLAASNVADVGGGNNIDAATVSKYTFSVTYTDVDDVSVSTLGNNDVRVTGPNGFDAFAKFVSSTPPVDGLTVVATYELTPPGGKWNVTDNGVYTFTLQSDTVRNSLGLGQSQQSLGTIDVDMHVPEVTINQSAGQADPTNGSPINFTVVFSEPVTGFDASDVLIGGSAGATTVQVTGSGTTYTVSITGMTQSGTVTAGVKAGGAVDVSNDANAVSTSTDNSVQFSTGPQGSLAASNVADVGGGNNIDAATVSKYTFSVTYTDASAVSVSTLGDNDVRVTGPNGFDAFAHFVSSTPAVDGPTVVATYELTPPGGKWNITDNGVYTFTLQNDTVRNSLGLGQSQQSLGTIGVDMHVPEVTINQSAGQADPTNGSPINFTVAFSEPVTGFDASDVLIGGTAGATTAQVSGGGATYTVSITGMTQSGTVTAGVKAGGAVDISDDANSASTFTDNSVRFSTGPQGSFAANNVADVGGGNNIDAATVSKYTFSVTYTDVDDVSVNTLGDNDVRVTGPNGFDAFAKFVSSTPPVDGLTVVATYELTPPGGKWNVTDNGVYTFTLQSDTVRNSLGLGQSQQSLGTIDVDMHVPEVTINQSAGQADPTNGSPINFTVVFSEPVTGFDASDVLIGGTAGATTAQVTGGGATYTVSITGMTQSGTVTASVKAGGAVDISNDANAVSTSTDNSVQFSTGPQGSLAASNVADVGPGNNIDAATVSKYTFLVTYTDASAVSVSTLGDNDVRVTGPNGFDAFAHFVASTPAVDGPTVVATYELTPPGGKWNVADNGVYTFTLQSDTVLNTLGIGQSQQSLGTIGVDMHVPGVTINQSAGQADPTNGSPINFTVVFSELVTGFDASDVLIGGTAGATTAQVTGGGATYTVSVTGMTQSGTVTASVKAGGAVDVSNDANAVSTSTDNQVTVGKDTLYATGADAGGGPHVKVYDVNGDLRFSFFAYDSHFVGGVRVATGDVTGDGVDDIITAAGPSGGPHVRVFNGATGTLQSEWFAYASSFTGGIYVAVGDVNGDGVKEVITGADAGGGPHVRVFNAATSAVTREFFAYATNFTGGVRVAGGDVDNDGFDDIITGAGPGGGPHVIAFSGKTSSVLRSFFAYDASFTGGVFVAAGDIENDRKAEIVTGGGIGSTRVNVFGGASGSLLRTFLAYDSSIIGSAHAGSPFGFNGGVRVAINDCNGDGINDIITGPGPSGEPLVQIFHGQSLANLRSFFAYDPTFIGGIFVG